MKPFHTHFLRSILLLAATFLAVAHLPLAAQTAPIDMSRVRNDDEDYKIFLKPADFVWWGIGVFGQGKITANLGHLSTAAGSSYLPSFSNSRINADNNTEFAGLDLRPGTDYGISIYAPMLATVLGRNIGLNLDIGVTTYRFGVLYTLTNMLNQSALTRLKEQSGIDGGGSGSNPNYDNLFQKFYTSFRYLNFTPMLNISGFLMGVNIGVPMPGMPSSLLTPQSTVFRYPTQYDLIPRDSLRLMIEPRIGFMAPIITTRTGSLNFLANLGFTPRTLAPLTENRAGENSLIRRSNALMSQTINDWWTRERLRNTTLPSNPYADANRFNATFPLEMFSLSLGVSYMFNFGNANLIDEFELESYRADSIRAVYAGINRISDSLKTRSATLADSLTNTIIAQSDLKDSLGMMEKMRAQKRLQQQQDSINRASERVVFAAKEELDAMRNKSTLAVKQAEESAKQAEKKAKQAESKASVAERKALLAEKKANLAENKASQAESKASQLAKQVFSAEIGTIVGMNEDESGMADNPVIQIQETPALSLKVLVPTVFFGRDSDVFPALYKRITAASRDGYKLPDVSVSALKLHGELLNIIAKRMQQNPQATLVLSGSQASSEADPKLSQKRTNRVATYLMDVWKIPASRIKQETKPQSATSAIETRAVIISSSDTSICAPYSTTTLARTAMPPIVTIGLNISAGAGLKQWRLLISQIVDNEDMVIKDTTAKNLIQRYLWFINENQATMPRGNEPLSLTLEATDITNTNAPTRPVRSIQVRQTPSNTSNNAANGTLFLELLHNGNPSGNPLELTPQSQKLLEYAKSRITPESKARITVYGAGNVSANEISAFLGISAANISLRSLPNTRFDAQTAEGAMFNNMILLRIDNVKL